MLREQGVDLPATYGAFTKYGRPSGRTMSSLERLVVGWSGESGRSTSAPRLRPMTDTRG